MSRECQGLPLCRGLCPLCLSLQRLAELGHRGILSLGNYSGLVNRVRILYGEVLDLLQPSGSSPVAAGEPEVEKPPGQWESPRGKKNPKEERSDSPSPVEKVAKEVAQKAESPGDRGGDRGEQVQADLPSKSEPRKASTGSGPVNPEEEGVEPEELEEVEEASCREPESPVEAEDEESQGSKEAPVKAKKEKKRKKSKKAKDHKTKEKDRHLHRVRRAKSRERNKNEPIGASPRLKEALAADRQPLRLRPKSPSYPPPSSRRRESKQERDWEECSEDSRNHQKEEKSDTFQKYHSYWREGYDRGWEDFRGKKRSKGQTRVQRWEDIRNFGPDPDRKKLRETHQSYQWK